MKNCFSYRDPISSNNYILRDQFKLFLISLPFHLSLFRNFRTSARHPPSGYFCVRRCWKICETFRFGEEVSVDNFMWRDSSDVVQFQNSNTTEHQRFSIQKTDAVHSQKNYHFDFFISFIFYLYFFQFNFLFLFFKFQILIIFKILKNKIMCCRQKIFRLFVCFKFQYFSRQEN